MKNIDLVVEGRLQVVMFNQCACTSFLEHLTVLEMVAAFDMTENNVDF